MKIEWTKDMTKRVLIYVVSGIGILAAYFILINLKRVSGVFAYLGDILRPFIIAAIFAYILNVCLNLRTAKKAAPRSSAFFR